MAQAIPSTVADSGDAAGGADDDDDDDDDTPSSYDVAKFQTSSVHY